VEVAGSVSSGFELLANGDLFVKGGVESGARVGARGDVTVLGGIVGSKTRVSSQGTVTARFVYAAQIRVAHDLQIAEYCHEANIEAGGQVVVKGKERKGDGVVGGIVWATGGVETSNLGSASNPNTIIVAGVSRDGSTALEEAFERLQSEEEALEKLLRRARPGSRAESLQSRCKALRANVLELERRAKGVALNASVTAKSTCFAGTRIRVGLFLTSVQTEVRGVTYHLDPAGVQGGVMSTRAHKRR
jgi:uncharacterized protein (DUF342 family)